MGPQQWALRKCARWWAGGASIPGFNGAAAGGAAETAGKLSQAQAREMLQWGRSRGSCGSRARRWATLAGRRASMGPQQWKLRKHALVYRFSPTYRLASVGPQQW